MKTKVTFGTIVIILAVLGGAAILTVLYSGGTNEWMFRVVPEGIVPSPVQTTIGTITIHAPLPQGPATVPLYHGYYGPNGKIEFSSPNRHTQNSIPEVSEVPQLAEQALAPYGGIPSDAVVGGIGKMGGKATNLATGEVVAIYWESTNIAYYREINGMPMVGSGGQMILLDFGENGELLHLYKKWLTLNQIDQVPIINASQAVDKLLRGDVLNAYQEPVDVMITNISLGYYTGYPDREEETLEPVWILSGPTSHGGGLSFYVDARVSGSSLQFGNFTASPLSGTAPLTVSFNDTSTGSIQIWQWDFGDGTGSGTQNPVHTYLKEGMYTVKLFVVDDERDNSITKVDYITVRNPAPPVANFTAAPTSGKVPLAVQFTDTSLNTPTGWSWEFGDGTTATAQNPGHTYPNAGMYTVNLTVANEDGSAIKTRPDYITVIKPDTPIDLIDQLILYINNQNDVPKMFRLMWTGQLKEVRRFLNNNNNPSDAVLLMKYFRISVGLFKGWIITGDQAATMQNSADAIIREINLPVNQAAIDQTKSLSADVKNLKLPASVEHPLILELEGTLFSLECAKDQAAVSYLNMFISSVKAQDGEKIPHDKAVQLIAKAEGIKKII